MMFKNEVDIPKKLLVVDQTNRSILIYRNFRHLKCFLMLLYFPFITVDCLLLLEQNKLSLILALKAESEETNISTRYHHIVT